jgi:NAD(P)-dependent dehydrogenase (short-subunit alcohol dehydrogenase family)
LDTGKFAVRGLCQSLARQFGPQGIHVFHVVIDGIVDMENTRAFLKDKPDEEFMKPGSIADVRLAIFPRSLFSFHPVPLACYTTW